MRKRKTLVLIMTALALPAVLLIFGSCYRDYNLSTSDYDTVVTSYDPEVDFNSYATFYIDPVFKDLNDLDNPSPDQPANGSTFVNALNSGLTSYGWTAVASGSEDVTIQMGYTETDYFYYYCYPYYGWYYYPYCGYQYSYSGGTVITQMVDPNDLDADNNPRTLWSAGLNGVTNDTTVSLQQRIQEGIAQAFSQSPYLDIN